MEERKEHEEKEKVENRGKITAKTRRNEEKLKKLEDKKKRKIKKRPLS